MRELARDRKVPRKIPRKTKYTDANSDRGRSDMHRGASIKHVTLISLSLSLSLSLFRGINARSFLPAKNGNSEPPGEAYPACFAWVTRPL